MPTKKAKLVVPIKKSAVKKATVVVKKVVKPVNVKWLDAKGVSIETPRVGLTPQQIRECKDLTPYEMENAGFIVEETETYIVVAFEHNIDLDTYNKFVVVPKRFLKLKERR